MTDNREPRSAAPSLAAGDLVLADGLLLLLERALDRLPAGAELHVVASAPSVGHDLPAWCRRAGHEHLGAEPAPGGIRHRLRCGSAKRFNTLEVPDWGVRLPRRRGGGGERAEGELTPRSRPELDLRDITSGRAANVPERGDPAHGFAPRGAVVERGAPLFAFTLDEKERVWADEAADLYEQGTASAWDASKDVPWGELAPIADELEESVCQVMTFLAENELSALYVPAKFVPRIHPAFIEVVLFLAQQSAEEARHYEAFVKRALANGGGLRFSAATGQLSLKTLLDQEDFPAASFLLSVLGEGTFVDLLRFVETHAPDPATRELSRRARADETRHVHFGVAHTRAFLAAKPRHRDDLIDATRLRAGTLAAVTSPSPLVLDALAILAAGSLAPSAVRRGVAAVRELEQQMAQNRERRLIACGFPPELARELSSLHTANFM